jgi:hypothetical protein
LAFSTNVFSVYFLFPFMVWIFLLFEQHLNVLQLLYDKIKWNDCCIHEVTHASVQCDKDYFSGAFQNLCSMFKVMGFILRRCINMAKIIVRHKMFNVKRGSFRTSVNLIVFTIIKYILTCAYISSITSSSCLDTYKNLINYTNHFMCVFIESFGGKGAGNWLLVRSFVHRKMFKRKAMEWKQEKAPRFCAL